MQHLFLTGEIKVGKSTIISRITSGLDFVPAGFNTVASGVAADGRSDHIFILPYGTPEDEISDTPPVAFRDRSGLMNRSDSGNGNKNRSGAPPFKAYPEVFDTIGADILRNAAGAKLIIMDELGFMEKDAFVFQREVLNLLDGEAQILGVIKPRSTPFLDSIRAHEKVTVIEVTIENRESVYEELRKIILHSTT